MSLDQLKKEVAALNSAQQAELIRFTLQLRHASDPNYQAEVTSRLNDTEKASWLSLDAFSTRLDQQPRE